MDLLEKLNKLIDDLDKSVKSLRATGQAYAQADKDYKMKLSETLLRLEAEGRPVSNLLYIARGMDEVAEAKYQQIAKEAIYKANYESIQSLRLQIRVLNEIINKEYE